MSIFRAIHWTGRVTETVRIIPYTDSARGHFDSGSPKDGSRGGQEGGTLFALIKPNWVLEEPPTTRAGRLSYMQLGA